MPEEKKEPAPEDAISGKQILKVSMYIRKLHRSVDPDDFDVYFNPTEIEIVGPTGLVATLKY